jgi:hypothetical protein
VVTGHPTYDSGLAASLVTPLRIVVADFWYDLPVWVWERAAEQVRRGRRVDAARQPDKGHFERPFDRAAYQALIAELMGQLGAFPVPPICCACVHERQPMSWADAGRPGMAVGLFHRGAPVVLLSTQHPHSCRARVSSQVVRVHA